MNWKSTGIVVLALVAGFAIALATTTLADDNLEAEVIQLQDDRDLRDHASVVLETCTTEERGFQALSCVTQSEDLVRTVANPNYEPRFSP